MKNNMTQQEIQERNKQIALMLGAYKCSEISEQYELPKYMTFQPRENSNLCHTAKVCLLEDMQFQSDYNWLMEAVEFIEKKIKVNSEYASDYNVVFDSFSCSIETTGYHQKTIININNQNRKEALFLVVSDFAKLYNNKKLK